MNNKKLSSLQEFTIPSENKNKNTHQTNSGTIIYQYKLIFIINYY